MENVIIQYEDGDWSSLPDCKKQQLVWVSEPERIYGIISQYECQTSSKFSSASRRATDFGKADFKTVKHDVYWDKIYGETSIEFDGTPFMLVNEIKFACVHGPDQHKAKKLRAANYCSQPPMKKRRSLLPDTKKLDCPAAITVKEIIRFPDYAINKNTKWRKEIMSKKLRNDLRAAADLKTEVRYYVILPAVCDHQNHIVGQLSSHPQVMDPNFVKKLEVLVSEGVQSVDEVRLQLNRHLKELFPAGPLPSSKSKRFHPSKKSIKNRINIELNKVRSSLVHQDDLELLINDYKEKKPVDFVFFRKATSEMSKLLLVCQTVDQKRLLQRYGSEICILDAAHKELKYGLPLFVISVKTNVDCQPVGMFVAQDSTSESISEGLRVLKEANSTKAAIQNIMVCLKEMISSTEEKVRLAKKEEMLVHLQKLYCIEEEMQCLVNSAFERIEGLRNLDTHQWDSEVESVLLSLSILEGASWDWNPPFFVADLCKEEIQAVEDVFQSQIFVSYHRCLKAWSEWLSSTSLASEEQHELLASLHKMASCESVADFETAVLELKGSNVWSQNAQFQRWFCGSWLDECRKWSLAFRRDFYSSDYTMWAVVFREELFEFHVDNTVDGISTLNTLLKSQYLQSYFVDGHLQLPLSELYFILMSQVFPEQYTNYTTLNARCLSENFSYSEDIPDFIRSRPPSFLSHCTSRVAHAKEVMSLTINERRPGLFELHCEGEGVVCVDFGSDHTLPSCTCIDWQRYKLLCKHFFLIFKECSVYWGSLSNRYRNSPFFLLDNEVDINYEVVAVETVTNLEQPAEVVQEDVVIAVHNLAFTENGVVVDDTAHDFRLVPIALLNGMNSEDATMSIADIGVKEACTSLQTVEQGGGNCVQDEDAIAVHELDIIASDLGIPNSEAEHHLPGILLHSSAEAANQKDTSTVGNANVIAGDVIIQNSGHDYHIAPISLPDNSTPITHEGEISIVHSLDFGNSDLVIHSAGHDYHVASATSDNCSKIENTECNSEPSTVILQNNVFMQDSENDAYSEPAFQNSCNSVEQLNDVGIAHEEIETCENGTGANTHVDAQSNFHLLKKIENQLHLVTDPIILREARKRLEWVEEILNSAHQVQN